MGDMAKLVDTMDLIGLSLGMETYQVITFKFRETLELKMSNSDIYIYIYIAFAADNETIGDIFSCYCHF